MRQISAEILTEPPWTGASLSTLFRIYNFLYRNRTKSVQKEVDEITQTVSAFKICHQCGQVKDLRSSLCVDSFSGNDSLIVSVPELEFFKSRYVLSKKQILRGEEAVQPIFPDFREVRNNSPLLHEYILNLLCSWSTSSPQEFRTKLMKLSKESNCTQCKYVIVQIGDCPQEIDSPRLWRLVLLKSTIFFRVRVNDTKLPYLWLFLPVLLRVAPFAFIVLSLANAEKGLRFIQIVLVTAPASILLRRLFRIGAIHGRLPIWVNSTSSLLNTLVSFAILTVIETLPALILTSVGVSIISGGDISLSIRFFALTLTMLTLANCVVVMLSSAILEAYNRYEDVRHGARYTFMILNAFMIAAISFDFHRYIILSFVPGIFFSNLTLVPYGELVLLPLLISGLVLLILVIVIIYKFPLSKLNAPEDDEDVKEVI